MSNVDEVLWKAYCADPQFQRYLRTCQDFDSVDIERALHADEQSGSFDFQQVIIGAYLEDCVAGPMAPYKGAAPLIGDHTDGTGITMFSSS